MRFQVFLANFATTLFLVDIVEGLNIENQCKVTEVNKAQQDAKALSD